MNQQLPVFDQLILTHDPSQDAGKTAGMAKGLFLNYQDELYAGESAGFGLPVWKTSRQTFFPTLVSARWLERNVFEKVFRLDRVVCWQLLGIQLPGIISIALEKLTRAYMQRPGQQHFLLRVRNALFGALQMKSSMMCDTNQGNCRVTYEAESDKLLITVDGSSLRGDGELILLNEVSGKPFCRLRIGTIVQEDKNIPAWQSLPFAAILENPSAGIGFTISPDDPLAHAHWHLAGGREIGRDLNWAGLELTVNRRTFSYEVIFFEGRMSDGYSRT
jgi:hypothetical protein